MTSLLKPSMRILVIKPTSLGDVIQSLSCVCAIKQSFPDVSISFLVADIYRDLLTNHPDIDEVINFPISTMRKGFLGLLKARKMLKAELSKRHFDISLDLQGLARSAIAGKFSGAKIRVGYSDSRELAPIFYTHKIDSDRKKENSISRYLSAAKFLGAETDFKNAKFNLHADEDAISSMKQRMQEGMFCSIFPGARWETKKWPLESYILVAKHVVECYGVKILVGGSKSETELGDKITAALPTGMCINMAGSTSLKEMVAAIALSQLVVSNDSGPMHVAAAMQIPTVSIFGPTSPERIAPYGQEEWVLQSEIHCKGCYKRKCHTIPPPCMADIKPDAVIKVCDKVLKGYLEK